MHEHTDNWLECRLIRIPKVNRKVPLLLKSAILNKTNKNQFGVISL